MADTTQPTPPATTRVAAIDAYRGFVMFLMMAEVLHLALMAKAFPDDPVWKFLAFHQTHVEWTGCTLHDLIQPSFSFLVGVALPFSLASRTARGQSFAVQSVHALWRAILLTFLGVFLRSTSSKQTNFTFEDTLSQIGLGYFFLFLLGHASAAVAVARVRRHSRRLLGGVRGLYASAGPRPRECRREVGLGSPSHRLRGPLEQEHQPRLGVRPLVPESIPAREAVHAQRRRLRDAQLHPDARDDDPRPHRGAVAARRMDVARQVRNDATHGPRAPRRRRNRRGRGASAQSSNASGRRRGCSSPAAGVS